MSHELRNPLQVILTSAELVKRSIDDPGGWTMTPDKQRQYLEGIQGSGERLLELLNNLLDLARLETGQLPMVWRTVNPVELVREVEAEFQPRLSGKDVRLQVRPDNPPPGLAADAQRLGQVLHSLLDNALRCSPRGGAIVLALARASLPGGLPALRLAIADEGEAIPEAEVDSAFDSFAQDGARRCSPGGARLSLDICRHIVAAHYGRIQVKNRPKGGCEFEVVLPLVQPVG